MEEWRSGGVEEWRNGGVEEFLSDAGVAREVLQIGVYGCGSKFERRIYFKNTAQSFVS